MLRSYNYRSGHPHRRTTCRIAFSTSHVGRGQYPDVLAQLRAIGPAPTTIDDRAPNCGAAIDRIDIAEDGVSDCASPADICRQIYGVTDRNLVLRCSRQIEKSTFLANTIVFEACTRPGVQMLVVCPREEQARRFSHDRLLPAIKQSPLVHPLLLGTTRRDPTVMNMEFRNGARLFLRAAFNSADACRGLSADLLLIE